MILRSRYLFVRGLDRSRYARFLERLEPTTRDQVAAGFIETRWYDFATMIDMMVVADDVWGDGDLALCEQMGRHSCDHNLPLLYRVFFKFGSPNYLLDRASKAWNAQYDAGHVAVIERGETFAVFELLDFPTPHRAHCLAVKGWVKRVGELTGEQILDVEEQCKRLGDRTCRWTIRWM